MSARHHPELTACASLHGNSLPEHISESKLEKELTPEDVCAYEAMLASAYRLKEVWSSSISIASISIIDLGYIRRHLCIAFNAYYFIIKRGAVWSTRGSIDMVHGSG